MTAATAARMPLQGHLREARRRAVRAAVALLVGSIAGYVLAEPIMAVLREPIAALADSRNASLNYDSVTGAFDLRLRIALFAGVVVSSPVWLYEFFAFLTPGLKRREKKYTFGFLAAALPLFLAGCVAGLLMFPHMVTLLTSFASDEDSTLLQASYYVDFVMKIVLATGVAFVLPVFVVILNFLGLVSARSIMKSWRVIVIAIVVFSALVTPAADVLSMVLVAVPMALLFVAAVAVAWLHERAVLARRVLALDDGTGQSPAPEGAPVGAADPPPVVR